MLNNPDVLTRWESSKIARWKHAGALALSFLMELVMPLFGCLEAAPRARDIICGTLIIFVVILITVVRCNN